MPHRRGGAAHASLHALKEEITEYRQEGVSLFREPFGMVWKALKFNPSARNSNP